MKFGNERHELIKKTLKGKNVSVICNISSTDGKFNHIADILLNLGTRLKSIMGPQHGFVIDKQDNMIESGNSIHPVYNIPVYSLYGKTREPDAEMLSGVDTVVFDLQDVGARYYTYIYTMANSMKICAKNNIDFVVLDRPNPVNGLNIEGGTVQKGFESFVGQYPLPNRHGMTVGELAQMFNAEFGINCNLEIIKLEGWDRKNYWDADPEHEWIMPSPNIPTFNSALVYPGQCPLEGTNISEGRGTTRPFEIFGAPYIKHGDFLKHEAIKTLLGAVFRPLFFEPTFNKFAGIQCAGFQVHVTNRAEFNSLKTSLAIIYAINDLYSGTGDFQFKSPPYEYEYQKMPVDILLGSDKPRLALGDKAGFEEFCSVVDTGRDIFTEQRKKYLLY
ncbi:MAG: DUF1343 domain-containing protein [Oligoflexia bacterium]|nr:DUF1343 domain-containing protein [Oligoflexia bacterium]